VLEPVPATGGQIAFNSNRDGAEETGEIYVMNADGSNVTRLTNNTVYDGPPSWGP
jgi:Tol biopolymer transport system component